MIRGSAKTTSAQDNGYATTRQWDKAVNARMQFIPVLPRVTRLKRGVEVVGVAWQRDVETGGDLRQVRVVLAAVPTLDVAAVAVAVVLAECVEDILPHVDVVQFVESHRQRVHDVDEGVDVEVLVLERSERQPLYRGAKVCAFRSRGAGGHAIRQGIVHGVRAQ